MTTAIKNRKLEFIKLTFTAGAASPTQNIFLNFVPDEMILKSWASGTPTAVGTSSYTIRLQGYGDLFPFMTQECDSPRLIHPFHNSMHGTCTFQLIGTNNAVVTDTTCTVVFTLEFVEYHK